jgi:hypothetical protein
LSVEKHVEKEEWAKSRTWLARAAFLLILAFSILVVGSAFKPVFPLALVAGLVFLYAFGRFCWRVQRSANARRRTPGHRRSNLILRLMSDWPVPLGLGFAILWIVLGVAVVEAVRHP